MRLGKKIPNFEAYTTKGKIYFRGWSGNSWVLMFSHPADFTPVCTTELGKLAERTEEFKTRGVKVIGNSCDSLESHSVWIKDIQGQCRMIPKEFPYAIIAIETREISELLDTDNVIVFLMNHLSLDTVIYVEKIQEIIETKNFLNSIRKSTGGHAGIIFLKEF